VCISGSGDLGNTRVMYIARMSLISSTVMTIVSSGDARHRRASGRAHSDDPGCLKVFDSVEASADEGLFYQNSIITLLETT